MRIGWVLPWIHSIGGNKIVFSLAQELSRTGHGVEIFAHSIQRDLVAEAQRASGAATLRYLRTTSRSYRPHYDTISWQLAPRRDRSLARLIATSHARDRFDALIVVSNEGHRLASLLRASLATPRPTIGCSVMELIDHTFLLRRERDRPLLRTLLTPAYPLAHWAWGHSLREFDFLLANSAWTAELLEYLYDLRVAQLLISLPEEAYQPPPPSRTDLPEAYVAVPTVSLGRAELRLLAEIARSGLPLVGFGPKTVEGIPHLGYLSEDGVREVMGRAAATLFLFDYEALGLVPFESLALGTPVVTLPKHGVHRQWRGNPFVTFAVSPGELMQGCERWLRTPPSPQVRTTARESVEAFRARRAAVALLQYLEAQRPLPSVG